MSIASFETGIWRETQRLIANPKMRKKDLMEWSTGPIKAHDGEIVVWLPDNQVHVAVKAELDKRSE